MAEIGTTSSSITRWPSTSVVHSTGDATQAPKRHQQKQRHRQDRDEAEQNLKKKPPDSGINSHIDEYA